VNDR